MYFKVCLAYNIGEEYGKKNDVYTFLAWFKPLLCFL